MTVPMFRSLLFVPAVSSRKIEKAFASEADGIIVDLEDSVAAAEKPAAREALATALAAARPICSDSGTSSFQDYNRVNAHAG